MGGMQNWNRKAKKVVEQSKIFIGQAKELCVQLSRRPFVLEVTTSSDGYS